VRYWWVNQNQTYRQEIAGGYLWSPKRNANGARNPFYEFMREVAPGDLVFSFVDTRIVSIGTVASYCNESPKPAEFGGVGLNWEAIGWRVRINFVSLLNKIRPKDHIDVLRRVLPSRYSPLQESGNGIQSVYLTEVPLRLAELLIGLIGKEAAAMNNRVSGSTLQTVPMQQVETADLEMWEHHIESEIESNDQLLETEREALIVARRGQGAFSNSGSCRLKIDAESLALRTRSICVLATASRGGIQAMRSGSTAKTDSC
jgi:putative restriction endonuclease